MKLGFVDNFIFISPPKIRKDILEKYETIQFVRSPVGILDSYSHNDGLPWEIRKISVEKLLKQQRTGFSFISFVSLIFRES